MSGQIVIRLDGEPRGKGRHRSRFVPSKVPGKKGFIQNYADGKTVSFENRLSLAAQAVMEDRELLSGPLVVAVYAYMGIPASWAPKKRRLALADQIRPTKKPDFDNLAKVCDALNKVVWTDDAIIVRGFVEKIYSDRPRLVMAVEPWVPAAIPGELL
jgi:Holliday junction resolvase RusA-like endonuclease